ncbi:MAG: NAD-dependent epimerase/dehydratase family protein, partial [Pollutimonas bauzanensis]
LTVYGDGSQTRSLCYVDDMIDGLTRMMESDESFRGPVNLGCPHESTVLDIARRIRRLVGADVPVEFRPLPSDDPVQRCPDILLARRHLDWWPRVGLDSGLQKTIAYFAQTVAAAPASPKVIESFPGGCKVFSD